MYFLAQPWLTHLSFPLFDLKSFFYSAGLDSYSFFFFASSSKLKAINTCIVLIDILNDNIILLLLHKRILSIGHRIRFEKLMRLLLLDIRMLGYCTGRQFLKLIPIEDDLVAASPSFLQIVEDGFPWVIAAGRIRVLMLVILFPAPVTFAL